ncbi:hypothetical protein [Lentisalinibacter salinarum]|uniref:hypothetical protein n=1 Tax=Lentisalinibacter salinarum TaxID=2992239 RepID=UPI003863287D
MIVAVNEPLPGDAVASFKVVDDGDGAGRPIAFGLPLADGAVPPGSSLVVTRENGSVLTSQWNELVGWRTSNSPLHGVVTFLTPDAGNNSGEYFVKVGEDHSAPAITKSDVIAAGFEAEVSVRVGGVDYRLSAADLLAGTISPRQDYVHYAGPLSSEFVVGGPLRQNGTGAEHETLQAYFYVRAFQRPVERAYVTVVLENTGAFNRLSDVSTETVDVTVDGISLQGFPKSSFTVFADVRYQKRAWWNGDPQLWVAHDVEGVQDTSLVPEYRNLEINESTLAAFPQATEWNARNILSGPDLDSGGAKPELAPYDRWTAAYLISGDRRAWNAMRAAQDEYAAVVRTLGSALSRARDEETGFPIDLGKKGVVSEEWGSAGDSNTLLANRDGIALAKTDLAHQPAVGYVTYLLTGESNELEALLFSAVSVWLNERPGGYPGLIPDRRWGSSGQVRSLAWGFREVLNAGTVTPADHPLHSTMEAAVSNALTEMNSSGRPLDESGDLGIWLTGPGFGVAVIYSSDETPNPNDVGDGANDGVGYAPWQDDWLTWSIGSAYERGWKQELSNSGLWEWKAQAVVGRFGNAATQYCWDRAANYALGIQDTAQGPFYASWSQIFSKNYPTVTDCAPSGASMSRSDSSATGYGAQIGPALAIAASTGIQSAVDAWALYDQRDISGWGARDFSDAPEWAISAR